MHIEENILQKISNIKKPQKKFIKTLMWTKMLFRGEANYRNLSRYSDIDEKTYSRGKQRSFDFVKFNRFAIEECLPEQNVLLAVLDCSFISKSGKRTYGLDMFYNGSRYLSVLQVQISDWVSVSFGSNNLLA